MKRFLLLSLTVVAGLFVPGMFVAGAPVAAGPEGPDGDEERPSVATAEAWIAGCNSEPSIHGYAKLAEIPSKEGLKTVAVQLFVRGLPDGKHAVHIHQIASCEPCSSAGGHFDPGPAGNASPDGNHPFHMGDLVNLKVTNRYGKLQAVTTRVTLSPGPLSIFDTDGSALVIHINEDTYCPDGEVAGCAGGGRAACGIIMPR